MYDVEPVFVDTAGRNVLAGPAITQQDFFDSILQRTKIGSALEVGYGVIEQGQTQALVATYRKEAHDNSQNKA